MLPYPFVSGQVLELQTTAGMMMFIAVDLADENWLEIRWDFPPVPEVAR